MGHALSGSADPEDLDYCYLTTVGRASGRSHEVEIWFAIHAGAVYLLSGDRDASDWVQNLMANPEVTIRVGEETRTTTARVVTDPDEDALARRLLVDKYRPRHWGELDGWGQTSLPVAVAWRDAS